MDPDQTAPTLFVHEASNRLVNDNKYTAARTFARLKKVINSLPNYK